MNFRLVILFSIISLKGSSQETKLSYHFDYYTVYEYKKDPLDSNPNKDIYYSNSKDNSYLFTIIMKKDTIFSAILIDYSNQKMLIYKDELHKNNINDVRLFKSYISKEYNLDYCKNVKNSFYDINYKNIDNKKTIIINRIFTGFLFLIKPLITNH